MQKQEDPLRRELPFVEAIALSIGIMAPAAAMALNGSLAASIERFKENEGLRIEEHAGPAS